MNEQEIATDAETDHARPEISNGAGSAAGQLHEQVLDALRTVYDPELGINVVDLGLVYDVNVDDAGGVDITYSLTTMGCPIGPLIEDQMRASVNNIAGVTEIRPDLVFRPAWSPEMMSEEAKAALGIF